MSFVRRSTTTAAVAACLLSAACGRGGDETLWKRRYGASDALTRSEITGDWQGDVFTGGLRVRIEAARITVAMKCDAAGDKLAEGSAPIVFERDRATAMVLQADLAGGDPDCGFRFGKGDTFAYRWSDPGRSDPGPLEIAFGNASVSRLTKLGDLPASR